METTHSSTLEQFLEHGLRGKSATTINTYASGLSLFERWLQGAGTDLVSFSRADLQQYIDYLAAKKKSAATINKAWHAIKSYCRWAKKMDAVEDVAVVKQPDIKKQAPKALDKIERNRLLREIDRTGHKRNIAIITLLLHTGLRVSELVSLDRQDMEISERKGELRVVGKGNKERVIPLSVEARRTLIKYLEERVDDDSALFLSTHGTRISVRSVQHLMERYGFHAHQMRHTFITGLVRAGQDISVIQSLSGHASADMILRYSMPSEEDRQMAVEGLYKN